MSLRGAASITGIGELKPERRKPGRTGLGLAAEVARECIEDAGLRKDEVDGLIVELGAYNAIMFAEYMELRPTYASSIEMWGSSGPVSVVAAAAAVQAGMANNVLCIMTSGPGPQGQSGLARDIGAGGLGDHGEWAHPYGPGPGANYEYAQLTKRYQYEYGLTDEQRASVAVQQRFNAQGNPNAGFYGTPISTEDVLNSRMIADPLRLLECVMPMLGASALMVSRPEAAKHSPHPPVYLLGAGQYVDRGAPGFGYAERMTTSPVVHSAKRAFAMAGVGPQDMDVLSLYDCYTITVIVELEDAGFAPKGEGGPFIASTDITYKGELPINTHGGQLSFGQAAGGMTHVTEGVRQLMGRGEGRQVDPVPEYCFVNG